MNNNTLLITAEYYKRNTVVNGNVDDELIIPNILKAQNLNIERILGTNLFNLVITEVQSGTVSPRIKTLIEDYIQVALVEWVSYHSFLYLNYKLTNKAVSKKSSDNSEPSDISEVNYLRMSVKNDAEYYSDRITKFLKANIDIYREYYEGNSEYDEIRPTKKNFFGGIYLSGNDFNGNNGDCCDEDYGRGTPLY